MSDYNLEILQRRMETIFEEIVSRVSGGRNPVCQETVVPGDQHAAL